ncbi:MAG: hypothetical protein MUC90_00590 [Thermoplasmata archaeon]|jgi:hypothetical protein|nr:hypothetical protein [Thermoplasmata archaeon]
MPASGKVLEDSIRLSRIRKIKRGIFTVEAVILVALGAFVIFVVGEAQLQPYLFLPLDGFLAILVLLLLMISVESFFFRMLEVKFARSSSARHLIAKNSIKRSILVSIFAGIAFLVLAVPSIIGSMEESAQTTFDLVPNAEPPYFYTSDTFAIFDSVAVSMSSLHEVHVYLVSTETFETNWGTSTFMSTMYANRLNREDFTVNGSDSLTISVPHANFGRYYLVLNDAFNPGTGATAVVITEVSGTFTGIMWILTLAFLVANIAWIAYLIPVERKYSVGSIYK